MLQRPFRAALNLLLLGYDTFLVYIGVGSAGATSRLDQRQWKENVNEAEFREQIRRPLEGNNDQAREFSRGKVVNHLAEMNRKAANSERVPQDVSG